MPPPTTASNDVTPFAYANRLFREQHYEAAVQQYVRVIEADPSFTPAYLNLSYTLKYWAATDPAAGVPDVLQSLTGQGAPLVTADHIAEFQQAQLVNTTWYQKHYAALMPEGVDPVIYYLAIGWRLGHRPSLRYKVSHYDHLLWAGHSASASSALYNRAAKHDDTSKPESERTAALWALARWHYFQSDYAKVLSEAAQLVDWVGVHKKKQHTERRRAAYLCHFAQVALSQEASEESNPIAQYVAAHPQDADAALALSNTLPTDAERLAQINRALAMHGLMPVARQRDDAPLSLQNLCAVGERSGNDGPLVSVIMPVYNAVDTVSGALASVLAQTYANLEIIVVDDASTDGTLARLVPWQQQDARVRVIQASANRGAYAARNLGLQAARGAFVTTHDSDDWSHPEKLAKQVAHLQANPAQPACAVYWARCQADLRFTQGWRPTGTLVHWSQSSLLVRRAVVEALGGWDTVRAGADTEYIQRIRAHYGADAITKLLPGVPLAFALDDANTLTRQSRTHVRTVYSGARHIYEVLYQHWHKQANTLYLTPKTDLNDKTQRAFPAPQVLLSRTDEPLTAELCVVGDFSREADCTQAEKLVAEVTSALLFHWPSFHHAPHPLHPRYAALLNNTNPPPRRISPVVAGETMRCQRTVFTDPTLRFMPLDALPEGL